MRDTDYAFCVAKIRALENKLLSKQDIAALIGQRDFAAAMGFLSEKGYAAQDESSAELIKRQTLQLNAVLNESVPDKRVLDALYLLNDYFNLKVMVKCAAEREGAEGLFLFPTTAEVERFDADTEDGSFAFLKEQYRKAATQAYAMAVKSGDGRYSDVIIDTAAICELSRYAKMKKSGLLGKICGFIADTANIKIALRCIATARDEDYVRAAVGDCFLLDKPRLIASVLSGGEALEAYLADTEYKQGLAVYKSNPSAFEKWCDDRVMKIASDAVYTSFGFDPVVYYYYRKNLEIKTVRMILAAKRSDIDTETLKERVRELYA